MIDAARARRRAEKNRKEVPIQYGKIEKCIKKAADRGEFKAIYDCTEYDVIVLTHILYLLKRKGYTYEVDEPADEMDYFRMTKIIIFFEEE